MASRQSRPSSTGPEQWQWMVRATSTSPIAATTVCARSIPRGRSPRLRGRGSTDSAGTEDRQSRPCSGIPLGWRWTRRATSTSPIGKTSGFAKSIPPGRLPRLRAQGSTDPPLTPGRRSRPSSVLQPEWRWTAQVTFTSLIPAAAGFSRSIPPGRLPRLRAAWHSKIGSAAPPAWRWTTRVTSTSPSPCTTGFSRSIPRGRSPQLWARRPKPGSGIPPAWLWTTRTTSTSPIGTTTGFSKSIPRGRLPRLRGRRSADSVETEARRFKPGSDIPPAWQWTVQATSTSPIRTTTGFARSIPRGQSTPLRGRGEWFRRGQWRGGGGPAQLSQWCGGGRRG